MPYIGINIVSASVLWTVCVLGMKTTTHPRIINGTIAQFNGTRYQLSIRLRSRDWFFGAGHICGGTLISYSIGLTAGHCVWDADREVFRNASELKVVIGGLNRFSKANSTSYRITHYELPETFNISSYQDDICILFLNQTVPADCLKAQPIPINWNTRIVYGSMCQVTGWGETEEGGPSDVLRVLDVPLIDSAMCKKSFGPLLQDSMLCAGYMEGGRDACFGDSGGPLVCNGVLFGVISTGYSCALPTYPGIYTNVALFGNWIGEKTGLSIVRSGAGKFAPIAFLLINVFLVQNMFLS